MKKPNVFKKLIAGLAISFLAAGLLTGCGQSNTNTTENTEANTKTDKAANPSGTSTQELVISAAASLKDSLGEIQSLYQKEHPNVKIEYNFASSGVLEQQIEQGAPADIFFSAGEQEMKTLMNKQLIDPGEETNLLSNQLVLITPSTAQVSLTAVDDLMRPDIHKIALGEPASVPAGRYAKEALLHDKLWQSLQTKCVFAKDVRQVLTYVETGNVDAGFVYKTDAATSKQVNIALTVDPHSYTPIDYPVGIVKTSKHQEQAKQFYDFLQGNQAKSIFEKYGFSLMKH